MAHQSGFGGSVTLGSGNAPSGIGVAVEEWTVDQNTETAEAYAKQELWKTKFAGPSDWTAQITCLLQDNATNGLIVASAAAAFQTVSAMQLYLNGADYFQGNGFVSTVRLECPQIGPNKGTYTITGNGAPAETFA